MTAAAAAATATAASLYTFPSALLPAWVLKRPSATIKSPYVADVILDDGRILLCHTPGLGCCGMVEAGVRILVTLSATASSKTACTAQIALTPDGPVGVHPMVSQHAARGLLDLVGSPGTVWKSEVVVEEGTRLDYVGVAADGKKHYVEIKNAMVSLQLSTPIAERRAVFPEGYRKKKGEPVSPRAVKHAELLTKLASAGERCTLLFTVPRTDCGDGLEPNITDPIYYAAVAAAVRAGVEVRVFALDFDAATTDGVVRLAKELPFYIDWTVSSARGL